jgi:hypothetical protein
MKLAIALLAITLMGAGVVWLVGVWISNRISAIWSNPEGGIDPIMGPKDRIAIYDTGPYIPMPDRLKTREEMVAWMTKELPKLTGEVRGSDQ